MVGRWDFLLRWPIFRGELLVLGRVNSKLKNWPRKKKNKKHTAPHKKNLTAPQLRCSHFSPRLVVWWLPVFGHLGQQENPYHLDWTFQGANKLMQMQVAKAAAITGTCSTLSVSCTCVTGTSQQGTLDNVPYPSEKALTQSNPVTQRTSRHLSELVYEVFLIQQGSLAKANKVNSPKDRRYTLI